MHEGDYRRLPKEMPVQGLDSVGRCCSKNPELASRHRYPSLEVRNSSYWCKAVSVPISLSRHVLLLQISLGVSACPILFILHSVGTHSFHTF